MSEIRKMYRDEIESIKQLGREHTFEEVVKILEKRTGISSKAPTLRRFCKENEISFASSSKKSRAGKAGIRAMRRKMMEEANAKHTIDSDSHNYMH